MRVAVLAVAAAVLAGGCDRASATAPRDNAVAPAAAAEARGDGSPDANAGSPATSDAEARESAPRRDMHEVTLPVGTRLPIVLETSVGSDTSRVEEKVEARLSRAVVLHGTTVVPEGSNISGVVTDATRSARVKGRAHIAIRFDTLVPRGGSERYSIRTAPVGRVAQATKGKDAIEILGPATGGAILGRIFGGRKGAAVGAAAGGGAGTAVVLSTRGKEVHLPRGAALMLKLEKPLTVRVPS